MADLFHIQGHASGGGGVVFNPASTLHACNAAAQYNVCAISLDIRSSDGDESESRQWEWLLFRWESTAVGEGTRYRGHLIQNRGALGNVTKAVAGAADNQQRERSHRLLDRSKQLLDAEEASVAHQDQPDTPAVLWRAPTPRGADPGCATTAAAADRQDPAGSGCCGASRRCHQHASISGSRAGRRQSPQLGGLPAAEHVDLFHDPGRRTSPALEAPDSL